ncbi:platelet-derived growth factor receptor-like protein [Tachyglossus aculeatus]|uniref:platelet-derived growth factor receptor-like protein n=1 Tax=Tachyglossus aculeatus TaxID=9261 RepID=UPI0018F69C1A|nr:platelet-derived growth factor receptor-like protein [Tachyglossus aculeatus]
MDPKALTILVCSLLLFIVLGKCQENKTSQAQGKKFSRAPGAEEVKPSKIPGRKPALVPPKAAKIKPQVKATVAAPSPGPQASGILTQVVGRGRFLKLTDTLVLPAGASLELRCRGRSARWRFPISLEEEGAGRLRIKHFSRFSQLLVVNSTASDTGEYSCWSLQCPSSQCRNGEDRIGTTFVFFTDPQELFVPTEDYYEAVQLRANQPTLLPCQVTSPLAKVTLHREFPPEEIPVDGLDISFDTKKGFTIHRPRASYAGSLFCLADLEGVQQISTKYMLIYVNYPSSPPKPSIKASGAFVQVGENFNVTCMVLGEPEIAVDFTWEYPGQQIGRPPYVRERTVLVRRIGQVQLESESVLYVDEARVVDDGLYSCRTENLQGSTTASTRVRVLPAAPAARAASRG